MINMQKEQSTATNNIRIVLLTLLLLSFFAVSIQYLKVFAQQQIGNMSVANQTAATKNITAATNSCNSTASHASLGKPMASAAPGDPCQ
jgi:hypothetical protein